jgi:PAS domain S-box-containing protein
MPRRPTPVPNPGDWDQGAFWTERDGAALVHLAIQAGGIGIYDTDFEQNRTRFSPELCAILGLAEGAQMTYAEASKLFHEDDRPSVTARVEAAGKSTNRGNWSGIHRVVRSDGTIRWVSIHGRRIYRQTPAGPKAIRSIGTVIDITRLKETEAARQEGEIRLRLALDAAQMGTFETDLPPTAAFVDTQAASLLGLPKGTKTVPADKLRTRVPLEDLRASDRKKERLTHYGEDYHHEFRMHMPDGSERWLAARAAVRTDRIFGVCFDVTRRKRAEAALQESEARLRIATNGAALGVFEWNVETDQAIWENERMYEIFGHARADGTLSKREFVANLHPEDVRHFDDTINRAMRSGENLHTTCRMKREDGSTLWLQIDGKFEFDGHRPTRLVGVVADITEHRQLEQQAKELSEQLVIVQEEERKRIAQELHDSTAQHLVAASLTLLSLRHKARPEDEKQWDDVQVSMDEALKELRTFSYLLYPPALRTTGLSATLRHYLDGFASRSGLEIRPSWTRKIDKLPFRLQHAVFRIIQEALANVHHHASASAVAVNLRWVGKRLHLIVSDNGRGVNGAGASVDRQEASVAPGIGLRGIKARVDQFGGELKIHSGASGTRIHAALAAVKGGRGGGRRVRSARPPHRTGRRPTTN